MLQNDTGVVSTYTHCVPAAPRSPRELVEIFHLVFLRLLAAGPDRSHYIVKGGCNLRFWFGSVRFSEDLDLDVRVTARATLKNKVDRLLAGAPLQSLLGGTRLKVDGLSAPKQTDVTQRWKVSLRSEGSGVPFQTKIEFSRRGSAAGSAYEPVDRDVARRYALATPLAEHYLAPAALIQKVGALAHRSETQARDVFDVGLLLTRLGAARPKLDDRARADLPRAIERAMGVSYDEFAGQVVAFLEDHHRVLYASREAWDQLQGEVVERLEELQ